MAKYRMGFVSNSSSSSFIVAFDREVTTEEKMFELFKKSLVDNSEAMFKRLFVNNESMTIDEYKEDMGCEDDEYYIPGILEKFNGNKGENIRVIDINLDQCDEAGDIEIMEDFVRYINETKNTEVFGEGEY